MRPERPDHAVTKTRVVVLTADAAFEQQARATFGASDRIELRVVAGSLAAGEGSVELEGATVAVVDLDAGKQQEMRALERLAGRGAGGPPIVAVTQCFDESVARALVQMRVADFLVKPVAAVDLVRSCARVAQGTVASPQVIINRFRQRLFSSGLRQSDIEQVLGSSFAACIPNNYSLVREAIDRGVPLDEIKPGNKITLQLRKLILPQPSGGKPAPRTGIARGLKLSWVR